MPQITLGAIDYAILLVYFVFVLGIGWILRRHVRSSDDFFLSGRSIPAWIAGLAFLSANLGAQEVIGMAASGAKYGIMTSHFYWVGAIPAMVFVGIFMMPFYYGSRARSVPEYLKLRFDEKTRGFNAITFAGMTVLSSGISMYALAKLLELILGWNFHVSVLVSAVIVLVYIFLGGLTSAIYNEVLQFFLIVLGFLPLVLLGLKDVGGWSGLTEKLSTVATGAGFAPGAWTESWRHLGFRELQPDGRRVVRARDGLGLRALLRLLVHRLPGGAAGDGRRFDDRRAADAAARGVSQDALPRAGHPARHDRHRAPLQHGRVRAARADGTPNYNLAIPVLLAHYLPSGLLGLGLTALMASFMSGMAGNVTAFNTVWTYDIYQSYIKPGQTDKHYLRMGHAATVFGILLSVVAAYAATRFNNIMDMLQLVFAFVNAPLFATFLLGMFWRRATGHGAFFGLLIGTLAAAIHHGLVLPAGAPVGIKGGFLGTVLHTYPSEMAQNFWTAIFAWTSCFVATIVISLAHRAEQVRRRPEGAGLHPDPAAQG